MANEQTIGLIIPSETYLFSPWAYNYYFTELLRGTIAAASLFEWNILIYHRNMEGNEDYINFCLKENVAGVVILAPLLNEEQIKLINTIETPVIIINARYKGISYVDSDNKAGAREAINYLIEMGHKKIAVINGNMSTSNAQDRFEGYKMAFADNKIKIDNNLVRYANYTEDSAYYEMNDILETSFSKNDLPTAVFCGNDIMAIGAIRAIKEKKLRIPEDISVIGFDDLIISSHLSPPLTTVRQPLFHLGKEAVITLIGIINEEKERYQKVEIDTRLIKRSSAAPPKTK